MTTQDDITAVRRRPYVVALRAGSLCYVYSGYDREKVRDRALTGQVGMTAANLDTKLIWLQPEHFHETYKRLCDAVGYKNVTIMEYPRQGRFCLRCGLDLTDVMGVYVFVDGRSLPESEGLLCVEHGSNHKNMMSAAEYLELRAANE